MIKKGKEKIVHIQELGNQRYNPFVSSQSTTTGITLVALVVTIVVLLILAGITIAYVMSDNSIFKKAQEAKDQTNQSIQQEQQYFNQLTDSMDIYINGNPVQKGEIVKEGKVKYADSTGVAVIPGGFCVVEDSKDNPSDKNTVASGLVISDVAGDDLDNSKHGNQFVWVPVPDYSKFHLIEGYRNTNLQSYLSEETNPIREAGDVTTAGSPGKPNVINSTAGSSESIAMYQSVKENKGFYIARFEAGLPGTTVSTSTNDTDKQTQDGSIKPVSQKGVGVWNFTTWGGISSDTASDGLPGNDNANGAVKIARSMYGNDGVHKVTSTLCYGVQWDAALNFMDSNYIKSTVNGYVKDSTGKGNYSKNIATTGIDSNYQEKHIYDMAGNVWEWTMEAYNLENRAVHGGDYNSQGNSSCVSTRYYDYPNSNYSHLGFRVTLYI